MAQIRIVSVDFYMNAPITGLDCMYSEFRGFSVHHVPVVRIFGPLSTGQKTCLHVHGVFPYIYIPYDGKDSPSSLMYQVASSLDKAINVSLGQASSNAQHIYKILLVSGIPLYGYHAREHQFFKIYFYNPLIIKKACTLLQSGNILGKVFQPHEAHIPYILQFMIDYNLHGMSFVNLSQIKYRFNSDNDDLNLSPDLLLPLTVQRQSICKIEADASAEHILNRLDVVEGKLTVNPGIKALWHDEKQRRRNKAEDSQILPCLTQTRTNVPPTATHIAFKNHLEDKITVAIKKSDIPPDANSSVYPAETPSTQRLLNASSIESHVSLSQNSDSTTLDETLTPEAYNPDATLDSTLLLEEDAQNLLELLKELRENVDKDSILSQVVKEPDSEDEEMDLSVPLGAYQTPKKTEELGDDLASDADDNELNDSYFNATISIPQLDGANDGAPGRIIRSRKNTVMKQKGNCTYNLRSRRSDILTNNERIFKAVTVGPNEEDEKTANKENKKVSFKARSTFRVSNGYKARAWYNKDRGQNRNTMRIWPSETDGVGSFFRHRQAKDGFSQFRYLDGTNDSSSEEDAPRQKQIAKTKRGRSPRKFLSQSAARYSPLAVTFGSPRKSGAGAPEHKLGFQDKINQMPSVSQSRKVESISTQPNVRSKNSLRVDSETSMCENQRVKLANSRDDSQTRHKRKLTFADLGVTSLLNETSVEQNLACRYKPARSKNTLETEDAHFSLKVGRTEASDEPDVIIIDSDSPDEVETCPKNGRKFLTTDRLDGDDVEKIGSKRDLTQLISERTDENDAPERSNEDGASTRKPSQTSSSQSAHLSDDLFSPERTDSEDAEQKTSQIESKLDCDRTHPHAERVGDYKDVSVKSTEVDAALTKKHQQNSNQSLAHSPGDWCSPRNPTGIDVNLDGSVCEFGHLEDRGDKNAAVEEYDSSKNFVPVVGPCKDDSDLLQNTQLKLCCISGSAMPDTIAEHNLQDDQAEKSTIVEAYDSFKNFVPLAGPSKCDSDLSSQNTQPKSQSTSGSEIPPYQRISSHFDLTKNLTTYDTSNSGPTPPTSDGQTVWVPKYNAPSRSLIASTLSDYGIPEVRYEEPFYGDRGDVTGCVEVGHNVLKIPSRTAEDLDEFETFTKGIDHYRRLSLEKIASKEKLTKREVTNYKLAFCKDGDCVVTPAFAPPTRRDVEAWLMTRSEVEQAEAKTTKERVKVRIPLSPGARDDDDSCDSLSISPCTPTEMTARDVAVESVGRSGGGRGSPVIKKNAALRRHKKRLGERNLSSELKPEDHVEGEALLTKAKNPQVSSGNEKQEEEDAPAMKQEDPSWSGEDDSRFSATLCREDAVKPHHQLDSGHEGEVHHTVITQATQNGRVSSSPLPLRKNRDLSSSCRITGVSFDNTHNFAAPSHNLQEAKAISEHQYLTVLSMEVHVQTRADFKPNPELDPIRAVFYSISNDAPDGRVVNGGFVVDRLPHSPIKGKRASILDGIGVDVDLKPVDSETSLIDAFTAFVASCDPDVLVGYEIETQSWGYLVERGYVLGLNMFSQLSRIPANAMRPKTDEDQGAELRLTGRIVIDFWRLMRHEVALQSYTFENIVYHILHRRVPLYSYKDLSFWWDHPTALFRHRTVDYFLFRVRAVLQLIDRLDLIGRTSELARLFGIQFYEVLSRGSQFRVESMMLRLAKPLNYIAASPSVQQRAKMRAPEFLPLIMEPESKFYADPVIVLDFQSLYPSMMIAYNYCFSTCLGRVDSLGRNVPFEFGATQLKVSRNRVIKLLKKDALNFAPCGVAFVKAEVRRGILPQMMQEILDTRLMVKKSMKENPNDRVLQKVLHARQLGLKLIANVTYGYTAANFSGRMPAVEVADSVVSKGRETLQRAIRMVEKNERWGARVVYGDTDSLFVLVAGRSRQTAFRIGAEIADAVTSDNPSPVKLKLEKVFHPCILQTKKRYVGYMYESVDQKEAEFCAKGIETVRRDGCPASSKMLEKCLKMLFDTRDVSLIRKYVLRQFSKLLTGRVSIQDLTFAKEYRGASGYRPGACVPALELARKWTAVDKRNEPRSGERVPYVVINGPPGLPLIRLVRSPRELLADTSLRPNALYYITKVIIPPINRCFALIGADLNIWFNSMPRRQIQYLPSSSPTKGKKSTISQYFSTTDCALCGLQTREGLCASCVAKPLESAVLLHEKVRVWERNRAETSLVCQSCCGRSEDLVCISLDCPVLYRLAQTEKDLQQSTFVRNLITSTLPLLDF